MGRIVGIDLGTTNSVVATVDLGGCKILLNKESESQTRSVVGINRGEFLIGTPALRRWPLAPKDTVISIKRLMGRAVSDPEVEKVKKWALYEIVEPTDGTKDSVRVKLGGKEHSPIDISAKILTKLKVDAEFVLGEEITHAVITVPAYFSDKQRHATREAGLKAGLTVMKILDEPTAAAIAFGIDSREKEAKTVLVYDLGGGTFDISVLMMAAGAFAPLNLEGDMWLGGDNFDQVIVDDVVKHVKKEYGLDPSKNLRFMATLKMEAQKAKETLSAARRAEVILQGLLQDNSGNIIDVETEITREQYEDMIKPLVERTVSLVRKAVENANLTLGDIDYVLMAGNATSVPMVQQTMEQLFGKEKILRKVHPKNSVAMGAAMTAALFSKINCPKCNKDNDLGAKECEKCGTPLEGVLEKKRCPSCGAETNIDAENCDKCNGLFIKIGGISNIAPFSYGVQTAGDKFNVFVHKGDQYETPEDKRVIQTFYTRFPNQRIICVPVYGGDNLDVASKNEKQGEVFAILPAYCPESMPIKAKLWLDKDGSFIVDTFLEDGTDLEDLILRGEADQKAVEILVQGEEEMAIKRDLLSPAEKEKAENVRNQVLAKMEKKEFGEAVEAANEYLKVLDDAGKEADPLRAQAGDILGYGTYIVNEYGWLIGQSVFRLNNLLGELQEVLDKNDRSLLENKINQLNIEIQKLMQTVDRSGRPVPTILGTFMALNGAIFSVIQPVDPVEASNLMAELKDIERAFKDRHRNAMDRFNAFGEKLNRAIEKAQAMRPEGIKCSNCGHVNRFGIRNCESCGFDLWLLGHERAKTSY